MLFSRDLENSIIFLHSKKFSKIPIFCSEKCSAILKIFKKIVPQISARQNSLIFRYFQCCQRKTERRIIAMDFIPYRANEYLENVFYQIPKELFINPYYKKVLYFIIIECNNCI